MKNFKLLLGATALLSTTAIVANATLDGLSDSITNFHVKAEIVNDLNLREVLPLDFGRIAWDTTSSEGGITLIPNVAGAVNISYGGIIFHDGGQAGEVCFTDLVPAAVLGTNLQVTVGSDEAGAGTGGPIALYAENETETAIPGAEVDFQYLVQATTPENQGERCVYIGADLNWSQQAKNTFPAGKVHGSAVVTVIYDSVNN